MEWVLLIGAILTEVAATLSLRAAVHGKKKWYTVVVIGYALAFGFLTVSLSLGLPLGIAYGIWAASGVALTAVLSSLLFKEPFGWIMAGGIALVIVGVLLVEIGSVH